jgi:small conductance mechanosensitive channel
VFNVSYHSDIEKVKRVLYDLLTSDARVLTDPAPFVFVQTLGENSMQVAARPWVKPDDYWNFQFDLPERVKLRFDAEGIVIPFPQRDVHLFQAVRQPKEAEP